ncbi:MAG TPA: DUF962 domain-containing protein [Pyrinomonadaceae bacterium]
MSHRYQSFSEFWPFYVAEHSKPGTRWMHLIGTAVATSTMVYLVASGRWWLFPLGLIPGYGAAWFAHFFIERNKPATFQYPLWSFLADYKMIAFMLAGKMNQEVARVTEDKG